MIIQVCVYCYRDGERCALHKGPGRSCCRKIHLSPPLPLSLAKDLAITGLQRYRDDGDALGDGGIRR